MVSVANSLSSLDINRDRLAKKTGITPARLDEIFDGAPPTSAELRKIAGYLRVPADLLVRPIETGSKFDIRYRKTPRKFTPTVAEVRVQEILNFLVHNRLVPSGERPFRVAADLRNRRSIEDAASLIRQHICQRRMFDPLPDLFDLADTSGLASCLVLSDLGIEGASTCPNGVGLVVVAARTFAPRALFTFAHELAHIVLGHTDGGGWLIDQNTIEAFDSDSEQERLCNELASALLQPAAAVARLLEIARVRYEIPSDSLSALEVLLVARYFCTSFFAAAMRLEHLEIAPPGSAHSFEQEIKNDHKSLEAYAEKIGLPDRTRIEIPLISTSLRRSIAHAVQEGQVSLGRVGDVLGYSTIEIADALS